MSPLKQDVGDTDTVVHGRFEPSVTVNTVVANWVIPGALVALSLVPALAGFMRFVQVTGGEDITPR